MQRVILAIAASFVGLIVVLTVRALTFGPATVKAPDCTPLDTDFIRADSGVVERFQRGLQFRTISWSREAQEYGELEKLQNFIRSSYPLIHSSDLVELEVVANYSLLYAVKGSDASLKPFMLAAHLDVVPAKPEDWEESPWNAKIRDGFIYGRGTIDFKQGIFGILEALEFMLKRGDVPTRPFYVAFGHDEEVLGRNGAGNIARILESRNVQLEFILDEGLTVTDGFIPGIKSPVAIIGTSEKGYLTLRLRVDIDGGHSSMPDKESSIGILARAIQRLEENQLPSQFGKGPESALFEYVAPKMTFPLRLTMSNLWLFGPLVSWFLSRKPPTNALIRTTTAITMFNAGVKENVIASQATAIVNHRIHPANTVQQVMDHDRAVIADDRVTFELVGATEPLPLSPFGDDVFGFETIRTSIQQVWKHHGVTVAPGLMIGGTDTKHYTKLSNNIYRFSPTYMFPEDAKRFHGINERMSVENYQDAVNFYYHVMKNADKSSVEERHKHSQEL